MSGLKKAKPPIIVLAGGKGTRLRQVNPDRPKPMVQVLEKPFLHWLLAHYIREGYSRFILSTGYMAEWIENYPWKAVFPEARIDFFRETEPLGTGGAVVAIFNHFQDLNEAWVINGDTLLESPLPEVKPIGQEALYTALPEGQIFDAIPNLHTQNDFVLAEGAGGLYFDAGAIYLTRQAIQRWIGQTDQVDLPEPSEAKVSFCSIHQVLRPAMENRQVRFEVLGGTCFDIGTPDRLKRFENYLREFL